MNKVITISLNGNAYQLEETGYEQLRAYLDGARAKLSGNPDGEEILRDLEQAVAEKLTRLMGSHRSVGSEADVRTALSEMGPVESTASADAAAEPSHSPHAGRRFYRIREGAIIGGVCTGLAAYFAVDVVLVRLGFVALTMVTGGGWFLIYFLIMIFTSYADTPEEKSRAEGIPWNAQEIMDRARSGFEELKKNGYAWKANKKNWKREWKQERRRLREEARARAYAYTYPRHHRSVIGDLVQLALLIAVAWAVYAFIPGTHGVYHRVGTDVQQGWAWLNEKVEHQ